jgi:uncharacterized Zn finger protein (UPF0148 family)
MLTIEEAELNRQDRLNEVGTMPACPLCGRPRVQRSDYIRCNPCGKNWLQEEMDLPNYLNRNPAAARSEAARMTQNALRPSVASSGADAEK